ncbi:MAG: hypothetical protein ACOX5T_08690 [Candidatus Cryptobacteroides sp.]|jgi:hypothetical protein
MYALGTTRKGIEEFEKLRDYVIERFRIVPEIHFIGWDIAITPTRYELVEMNCPEGHDF